MRAAWKCDTMQDDRVERKSRIRKCISLRKVCYSLDKIKLACRGAFMHHYNVCDPSTHCSSSSPCGTTVRWSPSTQLPLSSKPAQHSHDSQDFYFHTHPTHSRPSTFSNCPSVSSSASRRVSASKVEERDKISCLGSVFSFGDLR